MRRQHANRSNHQKRPTKRPLPSAHRAAIAFLSPKIAPRDKKRPAKHINRRNCLKINSLQKIESAAPPLPGIDFPLHSGILAPYLRCETGHQPSGIAGSFDFVVAIQRRTLSHPESRSASGFLPSTTTDFLAPRGNCVHHADHVSQRLMLQRRGRISVSHQTDSRVHRTLAINRRGPRSLTSAAAVSSQTLRTTCAGSTLASAGRNEFENG